MPRSPNRPSTQPGPPAHLGRKGKAFWRSVMEELEGWTAEKLELLRLAAEALDRGDEARRVLRKDGLTVVDRHGMTRRHPLCAVESDARVAFTRLVRQIGFGRPAKNPARNQWRRAPEDR